MSYQVLLSQTFRKQYTDLEESEQKRIKKSLFKLEKDPITPRSSADIKPLSGTNPKKYRLRVGDFRVIYAIEGEYVKIIEVFRRGKEY